VTQEAKAALDRLAKAPDNSMEMADGMVSQPCSMGYISVRSCNVDGANGQEPGAKRFAEVNHTLAYSGRPPETRHQYPLPGKQRP
jgi:hypothetical protein